MPQPNRHRKLILFALTAGSGLASHRRPGLALPSRGYFRLLRLWDSSTLSSGYSSGMVTALHLLRFGFGWTIRESYLISPSLLRTDARRPYAKKHRLCLTSGVLVNYYVTVFLHTNILDRSRHSCQGRFKLYKSPR